MRERRMSSLPPDPLLFDILEGPDFAMETRLRDRGVWPVAGLDEAGRGPLAGPVVAAAVILDPDCIPDGLNDSKKLTVKKREALFDEILACADVSIASSSTRLIDSIDIRKASLDAMRRALSALPTTAIHALIDGRDLVPGACCEGQAVIRGDARSQSIAAASIVAKVTRDRMMARLDNHYPGYGFAIHAGYATSRHRQAIATIGPCPLHRMSFSPFRLEVA
jgi:ribonuclease HII